MARLEWVEVGCGVEVRYKSGEWERAKVLEAKLLVRINSTPWFSTSLVKLAATSHDAPWLNLEYTSSKGCGCSP